MKVIRNLLFEGFGNLISCCSGKFGSGCSWTIWRTVLSATPWTRNKRRVAFRRRDIFCNRLCAFTSNYRITEQKMFSPKNNVPPQKNIPPNSLIWQVLRPSTFYSAIIWDKRPNTTRTHLSMSPWYSSPCHTLHSMSWREPSVTVVDSYLYIWGSHHFRVGR